MLYAGIGRDDFAAAFASDGFQGFSSLWWKNHIGRTKEVKELAVYGKSGKKKELLPQIENKKDESKTGGIWRLFSSEKLVSILTGSNRYHRSEETMPLQGEVPSNRWSIKKRDSAVSVLPRGQLIRTAAKTLTDSTDGPGIGVNHRSKPTTGKCVLRSKVICGCLPKTLAWQK